MKRSNVPARTVWRGLLWTFIATGIGFEIVGLITGDNRIATNGQSIFVANAVLLLWSWASGHKERIDELTRRENFRFELDTARNARLVELMDSAWRNDPVYREQRQKREASETYLRELKEQNK